MIVKMAIAKDNFIDAKDNPTFANTDTFIDCLQKIFTFEDVDILEFDGNTCQMINSYNPTNSIFIYTNDKGTFLYTITDATPRIHKNNMIWDCNTYKMEDVAEINEVLGTNQSAQAVIYKNIASKVSASAYSSPITNVEVKGNFKTKEVIKEKVSSLTFALKLKFMVNPTSDNTLVTKSLDGSYNFFFPIHLTTNSTLGNIESFSTQLYDGHTYVKLYDAITHANLKSVELIPFFIPQGDTSYMGGGGWKDVTFGTDIITLTAYGNAVYTECGIFFPQGNFDKYYLLSGDLAQCFLPKQLLLGGGARGFIRTPIGNIDLDFSTCLYENISSNTSWNRSAYGVFLKDEGWKIDGNFKAEIPPIYVNFYTDETGQLFIRNMTTNAQALRNIERDNIAKQEETQQNYVLNQVKSAETIDIFNPSSWFSFGQQRLADATQNEFDKAKNEREYNRALAKYEDDIATQLLQAQYSGRQLNGNSSLLDVFIQLNSNYYCIFIETNFSMQQDGTGKYSYVIQKDYDYSLPIPSNPLGAPQNTRNAGSKVLIVNGGTSSTYYVNSVVDLVKQIFGYNTSTLLIEYKDGVGTNYNIVFDLVNCAILGTETLSSFKFTQTLKFPIRKNTKLINFS